MKPAIKIKSERNAEDELGTVTATETETEVDEEAPEEDDEENEEEDEEEEEEEDEDDVEREMLLYVDFETSLARADLQDPNVRMKIIGIDTENPIIQINNEVYRGAYDYAMGTNVFFAEDGTAKVDPLYQQDMTKVYQYAGKTDKVLKMKRIFITPKETTVVKQEPIDSQEAETAPVDMGEKYEVQKTYEEALNLHLPPGGYPPRSIPIAQNGDLLLAERTSNV